MSPPTFPPAPVPPAEFLEQHLHGRLAQLADLEAARGVDLELGLQLVGEGGGEWVLALSGGRLRVRPGPRIETAATVVQRVEDWRAALWEGRGGGVGRAVERLFAAPLEVSDGGARLGAAAPPALEALRKLDGLVRAEVRGPGEERWWLDLKLGPGALPGEPTTTLSLASDDADRLVAGALSPLEALVSGRLRLAGDLGLLLQLQGAGRSVGRALAAARRQR